MKHEMLEDKVDRNAENISSILKILSDVKETQVELKLYQKDNFTQIGEIKEEQSILHELVGTVKVIATNIEHIVKTQDNHGQRISNIERKPVENWQLLIGALICGVVGYLFNNLPF